MNLTWAHRWLVQKIVATCRTAGAEGRFFPITCADPSVRRSFETAVREGGAFNLELRNVGAGTGGSPWPDDLRDHAGDHYNKLLWCLDGVPGDAEWFGAAESRRQQACKPGTWVILWLTEPGMARLLEERAPLTWSERALAPTLFTPGLLSPPGTFSPDPSRGAPLTAEGQALTKFGDPHGAMARYAEALWHDPDAVAPRRLLADLVDRSNDRDAAAGLRADMPPPGGSDKRSNGGGESPREAAGRMLDRARDLRQEGKLDEAKSVLDEAQETRGRPLDVLQEKGRLRVAAGVMAARSGDEAGATDAFDDARRVLADAFNMARAASDESAQVDVAMDLADLNFRAGSLEAAITSLDLGARLADEAGLLPLVFDIAEARRVANAAAGNNADALGDIRLMERMSRLIGMPALDARLCEAQGDHNHSLSIPGAAAAWWDKSATLWEELSRGDDAARCKAKKASLPGGETTV